MNSFDVQLPDYAENKLQIVELKCWALYHLPDSRI